MRVFHAFVVNVGCQLALDGSEVSLIHEGCKPLYVLGVGKGVESVLIHGDMVGQQVVAHAAPAIHVHVWRHLGLLHVGVGQFSVQQCAVAADIAIAVHLLVRIEGDGIAVLSQSLVEDCLAGSLVEQVADLSRAEGRDVGVRRAAQCVAGVSVLLVAVAVLG